MMIQGHPISEIIAAIFIILWGVIRFSGIAVLIVGGAWLIWNAFVLVCFLLILGFFAQFKTKW